ncbi:MAG TPA: hypothetical protein ENK11_05885, partial [Phycisphaerales bacterium]|nr:hypothetical protein [Phycisphaerales bacterium]
MAPLPPDDEQAREGLADVMRSWPARADAQDSGAPSAAPRVNADASEDAHEEDGESPHVRALRLYAEARQLVDAGRQSRAISLLEEAAGLEPDSPEIWRALGDARRAAGFEASSGVAYLKAADLGLGEPEALTFAGLVAKKRDEPERAAGLFIRALRAEPPHADPLVSIVAAANLGEVLLELGRVRAGCEALRMGLDLPSSTRTPTNMGDEISTVYRRRGELLTRLGDGWCRLGAFEDAAGAYREAAQTPAGNTPRVRTRLIYALRRAGRPAEAGLLLVEELRSGAGLDAESLSALADTASRLSPRSLLADVIAGIDDGGSVTRRVDLLLARAAALDTRHARRILEQALLDADRSPTSAARRRLLKARLAFEQPDSRIRVAAAFVAERPALAAVSATLLFELDPQPGLVRSRVERGVRDPAVRSALLGELSLLLDDRGMIMDAPFEDPAMLALGVALASARGLWDEADRLIGRIEAIDAGDGSRVRDDALIRAYEAVQRFDAALPVCRGLAERPAAPVDDLLRLSALSHLMGEDDASGEALDRALEIDPYDERVYRALIAFYGPNGPKPDVERTTEIGRTLREQLPSSRLLRQLVAGELLRRGLLDEASERISALLREDPTDGGTVEVVSAWWRMLAEADREIPLEFVRGAAEAHPASSGLVRLLAEGLVLLDHPAEALEEIDRYEARTGSRVLRTLAERITRETLDDPAGAAAMVEERIGPPPHAIDDSVDLASLYAGLLDGTTKTESKAAGVLAALREIPAVAVLTDRQRSVLSEAVGEVASHADRRRKEEGFTSIPALGCFDWAASRGLALAPATHALRLAMLVDSGADADTIAAAATDAIEEYPDSAQGFARRVVDLLRDASRSGDAFDWIADACFDDAGGLRPGVLNEWVRLVLQEGTARSGAAFIDTLKSRGRLAEAFDLLRPRGGIWDTRDASSPAEMAYLLAQYAVGSGVEGEHE